MANSFNGNVLRGFGRKAQAIADITGMHVLAYDREGTGTSTTVALGLRHELTPSLAVQNASSKCDELLRMLDSSNKEVVLYGHSGAAPEMSALALARTEKLPATRLGLSDPVAVRRINIVRGAVGGLAYNLREELPAKHTLGEDYQGSQLRFLRCKRVGQAILEGWNYSALWASDFTLTSLHKLAEEQPELGVLAVFASSSLMGNSAFIQTLADEINGLRPPSPHALPIQAAIRPNTLHSSFEDPQVASDVVMGAWHLSRPQANAA